MDDLFGLSMSSIMTVLLILLGLCLLSVAWVAWRRPVIFKLGVRNIPRRQAQTVLIVVGLMLSTLIIAAAFGTGDTIDYSMTSDVYDNLGHIDELIIYSADAEANVDVAPSTTFDAAALATVEDAVQNDVNVDGLLPMLEVRVPVLNENAQLAEPDVVLTGLDTSTAPGSNSPRLEAFGGLVDTDGNTIDLTKLPEDGVVLSEKLADEIEATAGNKITVFYCPPGTQSCGSNAGTTWTVFAVAKDSYLSGVRRSGSSGLAVMGMAMPLDRVQQLTNQPGRLTTIAVSNAGGVRDSLEPADAVTDTLRAAVAGQGLGVDPIKDDSVDAANEFSSIFTGLFLVLGLFSVAAGILLIVLIFTMLASERRPEMGMARAVGAQRRQLIQQFVSEGSGYALLSGLVGAALGVLAAIGIAYAIKYLFGDFLPVQPHVTLRSLIVAYCLGVVITFITVVGSSWKISRLNIVAAVRDIPDVSNPKRKRRTLVWAGLLLLFGALMTLGGVSSGTAFFFLTGISLLPFGVVLILQYFGAAGRPVYSGVAIYLLAIWILSVADVPHSLWKHFSGDFEMFFVSGIFMVTGSTLLVVQNLDTLLAGVNRIGGVFQSKLPAVRTAIAYPGAARGRTGMTIAMFSLIIFSLVTMATMNQNFINLFLGDDANAGWDVRADAISANPISDFTGELNAKGIDTSGFKELGVTHNPSYGASEVRVAGAENPQWKNYMVLGMDDAFIADSTLKFQDRAAGYESDAAIVEALLTEPNVAVIDGFAVPGQGGFGGVEDAFSLTGFEATDNVFEPIMVELADPRSGTPHQVKIIGIIDSNIGTLFGLYANQTTVDAIYPTMAWTSYFVALDDPDQADDVAKEIESALINNGVQADSIRDQLEEAQAQSTGFLYIIQGFMGLGLFVGVAAVGVIAFRSVVERRQQIGILRAIGYQRSMVSLSFMIETAFMVVLGVLSGSILAIVLSYFLFTGDEVGAGSSAGFVVPYGIILSVIAATIIVALLMTWVPAQRASRIAPAEALRYE